ncbi:PREDICTED: uncharacterized protein LOC106807409 [Priapulus caudatus]|uniref:Uncharacterized protein LOC106807409 n=1 Tax=Priapulus caudatus TaxID=37621 RepID=A0ABM1DZ44_PRICU|nr:PREDICTED: uncharacterized protein LOC106807409 [Priapulus caudatus]
MNYSHLNEEFSEKCLLELPWHIVNTISLYERMDVSFNRLSFLPAEMPLRIPHLSYLNVSYNQLTDLPNSFGLFFHLKTLLLANNKLAKLPSSFTRLSSLEKLDLAHNALEELPDRIGFMPSLRAVNVSHNRLRHLPASLGSENMQVLLAQNNSCDNPPQSVCNEGSAATLKCLRRYHMKDPTKEKLDRLNVFPRVRGNVLQSSVSNPDSARAQYLQLQTATLNTASRIKTPLLLPPGATVLPLDDLRDKILGMVYGAAIGDALGVATKFMEADECRFHYDPDTLTYADIIRDKYRVMWKKGDWSTDFDQVVLVLDSIIHWAGVVDELDFAMRLHNWTKHGFPELEDTEGVVVSNTLAKVLRDENYLQKPHMVAAHVLEQYNNMSSTANGDVTVDTNLTDLDDNAALARSLILGIPYFHNLQEVTENCVRICKASHAHPLCIASAVTIAVIVALMLQGRHAMDSLSSVEELLSQAKHHGMQQLQSPKHRREYEAHANMKSLDSVDVTEPGRQSFTLKPVAAAVISLRSRKDFRSGLLDVIMRGGDANCNATLTGAMLGCVCGYSKLTKEWLTGLRTQQRSWLDIKVNLLLDMMGIP